MAGLTFVFSGELSSLSREEGQELVKRYGGSVSTSRTSLSVYAGCLDEFSKLTKSPPIRSRVTGAPSGKTSYVVLGQDAGPKKLETIARLKIKTLNEDTFLELIGQRPAGAVDAKFLEKQAKEEKAIITAAKAMPLAKDSPCVSFSRTSRALGGVANALGVFQGSSYAALDRQVRSVVAQGYLWKQGNDREDVEMARGLVSSL